MEIANKQIKIYEMSTISQRKILTTANIQTISNPTTIINAKTKVSANHKDFSKAMKMIKAQDFYLYDTSDEWAVLFTDNKGRQWAVARDWEDKKNLCPFCLTIDDDRFMKLGKYSKYINSFLEEKKEEERVEKDMESYYQHQNELFRNYNYGMV